MCSEASASKDKEFLPFLINYLPEFTIRKCEEELNESPDSKQKSLQELRSLLQKNEKTSGIDFHEDFLIQYLRRNKYRIRDTFQQLQNFVHLNKKESFLFKSIPEHHFETVSEKCLTLLPKRCQDGCAIVLIQIAKWNPKEMSKECVQQFFFMFFSQLLRDPVTQINGVKFIIDFEESLPYIKYATPHFVYLFYNIVINCIPLRNKGSHFINESVALQVFWNIVKPFLSQKIKNRVFFHSNTSDLFQYFPRSIIPTKYGGTMEQNSSMQDWIKKANIEHKNYSIKGQPNLYSS